MFKIYYTDEFDKPSAFNTTELKTALATVEALRNTGYLYVTLVSDYADMSGKPGAKMSGQEYVPQMLN